MIPVFPRYLFLISSILVGVDFRPGFPVLGLMTVGIAFVIFLRKTHHGRSIALLGIFGLMFIESVLIVLAGIHFMSFGEPHHLVDGPRSVFDLFHHFDLGVSILGTAAAACAGVFIHFGKSRFSLSRAFPQVTFLEAPHQVKEMVMQLATKAGVHVPDIRLIDSGIPSAFTVRANRRYSVSVSVGLLESLEPNEVEACLAHEIAHLKNNDFTVRFLATLAKVALFAKPLSYLLEPAVYRAREYLADLTAVRLLGKPDAVISALTKLHESSEIDSALPSSSCVCNLNSKRGVLRVFDKHPALEDRLRILRELKQE